jgi:uncharacterized membrane protein
MITFLAGLLIYLIKWGEAGGAFFSGPYGLIITMGGLLGTVMFLNVWLVIWPNQKIVIASTNQVAQGGQALPQAAGSARRAALASRTNTVFSIPMLFFMGAAQHYQSLVSGDPTSGALWGWFILGWGVVALVELNALAGTQGPTKKPLDTVSGALWFGFILAAYFWLLYALLF